MKDPQTTDKRLLAVAFLAGALTMFLVLNHLFEGLIWLAVKRTL